MKIETHCLLHNEAPMIPYFVMHYSQYGEIFFYESDSTDGSPQIAKALGANVINLPTGDEVNELIFLWMKNNCWKNSKADWVFITDTDEFIYHPYLKEVLKRAVSYTMFYPKEYRMISREFPTTNGQIYDEVKLGWPGEPGYNKLNIFRPSEIKEMNYNAGCHSCAPVGNISIFPETDIRTLHFHDVGLEYRIKRNKYLASRISQVNKDRGWGVHVTWPEEKIRQDFENNLKRAVQVIP
jgi:glycosyltransferase involved in cell wall biosynthesis